MLLKSLLIVLLLAGFSPEGVTWAITNDMKKPCSDCHTMHNSQNGAEMLIGPAVGLGQQGALLRNTCYGCHTGSNVSGSKPYVFNSAAPAYMATGTELDHTTLAGGSFYWVAQSGGDLKGHNVNGLTTQSTRTPPGGTKSFNSTTTPLRCAGVNGCHGDRSAPTEILAMYQTHHAVTTGQVKDGSTLLNSYRLLNDSAGIGVGYIAGFEDIDYELSVSSSDHNQYLGVARSTDDDATTTISHSCAGCHGNFHSGASDVTGTAGTTFASPWIRHPVDYAMALTGEYANYGGSGVNAYKVETPLGSDDAPSAKGVVSGSGDAIIVCVSCHRAHGSPYNYSLRWNYKDWPGSGYNGCADCHTAKN